MASCPVGYNYSSDADYCYNEYGYGAPPLATPYNTGSDSPTSSKPKWWQNVIDGVLTNAGDIIGAVKGNPRINPQQPPIIVQTAPQNNTVLYVVLGVVVVGMFILFSRKSSGKK